MRYVCPLVALCLSHLTFSTLIRGAEADGDVEVRQADSAVQTAREHVRNLLEGNFNEMENTYAKQIVLMPGNELLKAKYALAGPKGEKEAITVDRTKLLGTMKTSLPRPLVAATCVAWTAYWWFSLAGMAKLPAIARLIAITLFHVLSVVLFQLMFGLP